MTTPGYPKLTSRCKYGDHMLRQDTPGALWVDAFDGQECLDAPLGA